MRLMVVIPLFSLALAISLFKVVFSQSGSNVTPLGYWETGICEAVEISGDTVFFNAGGSLEIFSIAQPEDPKRLNRISFQGKFIIDALEMAGDLVVAVADSVYLVDPRLDPPSVLSIIPVEGGAASVAVDSTFLFVAAGDSSVVFFDIVNPAIPQFVDKLKLNNLVRGLTAQNGYVYVANNSDGLRILSVTSDSLVEISFYQHPDPFGSIDVSDGTAYVGSGGGLWIFDVTDPGMPDSLVFLNFSTILDVEVVGNLAVLTNSILGVKILDVTNPSNPILLGQLDTDGSARQVSVSGSFAYVPSGFEGLKVIDFAIPDSLNEVGSVTTQGVAWGVDGDSATAIIAAGPGGFRIIDITDPTKPFEVSAFEPLEGFAESVDIRFPTAYLTDAFAGFYILDITDRANPVQLGKFSTSGFELDVEVSGGLAYLASNEFGLRVLDISSPDSIFQVGAFNPGGHTVNLALKLPLVFLASGEVGLRIVDVSDPANPVEVGFYDTPEYAQDVVIEGDHAFVSDDWDGVQIIDVGNPQNPVYVSNYPVTSRTFEVDGVSPFLYSAGIQKLEVIDISNVVSPFLAGWFSGKSGNTYSVSSHGDKIFVGQGSEGLYIVRNDLVTGIDMLSEAKPPVDLNVTSYPNPFNPRTTIRFDLSKQETVTLKIYNLIGQEIRSLLSEQMQAGNRSVTWDGKNDDGKTVSSGVYVYRIQAGNVAESKKMLLLK